jgi:hypothetical protein
VFAPRAEAVATTVAPLAVAPKPGFVHSAIEACRSDASVVVLLLVANVPVVPVHAFDPFVPEVAAAHE